MSREQERKGQLLGQIAETHDRYCDVMEERLARESIDDVDFYFGVVARLVAKLEERDKPLRSVAREMLAESAALILAQLGGR
jgi:hypothetical protein